MSQKPGKAVLGFVVLAVVLGSASWRLLAPWARPDGCDLSSQPCPLVHEDQELFLELAPTHPTPGEEFRLILRSSSGDSPRPGSSRIRGKIEVAFSMPGMEMGEHVVELERAEDGSMGGRLSLPFCPMGRSLWVASIRIDGEPISQMVLHAGT